jgi:hypothetical protein
LEKADKQTRRNGQGIQTGPFVCLGNSVRHPLSGQKEFATYHEDIEQHIRERAFYMWLEEGQPQGSISNTGDALNEKLAAPSLLRVLKENPSRQIMLSERSCSQLYEKSAEAASPSRRLPQGKVQHMGHDHVLRRTASWPRRRRPVHTSLLC